MFAPDGVLDANDFDLAGAEFRSATISRTDLTLELGGVRDNSVVTVGFGRLVDRAHKAVQGPTHLDVRALLGDVNGNGAVTAADLARLRKDAARHIVTNRLYDLDLNGAITAADILLARRRLTILFA